MMKHFLNILFLLLTSTFFGQSFEGTLAYVPDIVLDEEIEKMGMTKELMINEMREDGTYSDTVLYTYKHGDYHLLLNNPEKSWSIYRAESNKIYSFTEAHESDLCHVTDAGTDLEYEMSGKMPSVEKLDTTVIIDGAFCSIVRVKWSMGTYDYYYDPTKFSIDPSLFAGHVYDGWAAFLQISKALPVKIVRSIPGLFSVTLTLVKSSPVAIDDSLFLIPKLVRDKDLKDLSEGNSAVMRIKK